MVRKKRAAALQRTKERWGRGRVKRATVTDSSRGHGGMTRSHSLLLSVKTGVSVDGEFGS